MTAASLGGPSAKEGRVASGPLHVKVRVATADDVERLGEIAEEAGLSLDAPGELSRPEARLTVACIEAAPNTPDAVVGFLSARQAQDEVEIFDLAVRVSHRRLGVGRALVAELITETKAAAASSIFLEVREDNGAAVGLYTGCGFQKLSRRQRYYADGADAEVLVLPLKGAP